MSRFYIKKLQFQEMGSPADDGTVSRGRYILVSKKYVDSFFPHLSTTVLNDSALLPVVPPFENHKVYSTYVYHNDKYFVDPVEGRGQPRDEYRFYLNRLIDPEKNYYRPDDIVVFEKLVEPDDILPTYFMYRFRVGDTRYEQLEKMLKLDSPVAGKAHLVVDALPFELGSSARLVSPEIAISDQAKELIIKEQSEILESVDSDFDEIELVRGAELFNSTNFRDFVLLGYGYKCAITKRAVVWQGLNNLEAAHIKPKAHIGSFLPCNGIALSRDMHWAFDKGFLSISDDYKVIVHEHVRGTFLSDFHNSEIIVPVDSYFQPDSKYLEYHRDNIFGLFQTSGMIRRL